MATEADKENITDGFATLDKSTEIASSRSMKKSRSLSMGPGALSVPLKEDSGNRRKSAFIPGVKSIISGPEDDVEKRRAARRKSLANRRVSFAPEATLHTWDVIEYMRDATTSSSASSEATRRASSIAQESASESPAVNVGTEPPSTPPEQVEEVQEGSSPGNQRDMHQKKNRRRSSGIPPMNFNNPEDAYSSSPASGGSPASSDSAVVNDGSEDEDDGEDTAMSLGMAEEETGRSIVSASSNESTSSSGRLDDALRQASVHAVNQALEDDEDGEMSMEMAGDEITNAFKAFAQNGKRDSIGLRKLSSLQDQENVNPFSPAFNKAVIKPVEDTSEDDLTQDMSMDMTHVMGGIIQQRHEQATPEHGNKRRRLSSNTVSQGSPAKRPNRRSSMRQRRSSAAESVVEDETMEFTMAVGGIKQQAGARRVSTESSLEDETMDFTMVQGGIVGAAQDEEDLTMELTTTLDKTIKVQATTKPTVESKQKAAPSPARVKATTPQKSPRKSPRKSMASKAQPSPKLIELESPRPVTPQQTTPAVQVVATPPHRSLEPVAAIQFSPLKETAAKAHSLSDSIKLLSTPRKQASVSPIKRTIATPKKGVTPKKSASPKKAATPKRSTTPRKRVRVEDPNADVREEALMQDAQTNEGDEEVEKIHLQDFLNKTNIRFMDLTTTKRRHTGYPGADRNLTQDLDEQDEEAPNLENNVAAAVGTLPVLTMYQHMCHEMKNYISGGRDELRTLEAEVYETQPPLFKEYMSAPPEERNIMDNQFKNMKTNARLQSKAGWHAWRAQLLNELKKGLIQSAADFERDSGFLSQQEQTIKESLPVLESQHDDLAAQYQLLQQRVDEMSSYDKKDLEVARERMITADADIEEKQQLLAQLQAEFEETESRIEAVKERKVECLEEIKEAERVREEFRGWSSAEVAELKEKVDALITEHGWSVISASSSPNTLTISYLSDLELFFHPSSFNTSNDTQPNSPISLTYIGNEEKRTNPKPRLLTTTKRFFLQLLRAHLHAISQYHTPISDMLKTISATWQTALSVTEALRLLSQASITDEVILSDERMGIDVTLLLASLQTKVRIRFEVAASAATSSDGEISTAVKVDVKVVYGEKYDQPKMGQFLDQFTGGKVGSLQEVVKWATGIEDLRVRLIKRGMKGERID